MLKGYQAWFARNLVCLFVCLCFVPVENFSLLIWRCHHCRWRGANFDLCSALMPIEQRGFFSVLHQLWHWASVYNGHLQWPVTPTPKAKRLTADLSLPVLTTKVCRGWDLNTQPSACGANALTHCATAAARKLVKKHTTYSIQLLYGWYYSLHSMIQYIDT